MRKSAYVPLKLGTRIDSGSASCVSKYLFRLTPKFFSTLSVCSKNAHILTTPCLDASALCSSALNSASTTKSYTRSVSMMKDRKRLLHCVISQNSIIISGTRLPEDCEPEGM